MLFPPDILEALKNALAAVYWYKRPLRSFLENAGVPNDLIVRQRWNDDKEYKVIIVDKVVNGLAAMGDSGLGPLRALISSVIKMEDFSHLLREQDGTKLENRAKNAVQQLRTAVEKHDTKVREKKAEKKREEEERAQRRETATVFKKLEELKERFYSLSRMDNPQARGLALEPFLFDLFEAFDLQPRGSFKITGEQIDGAFQLGSERFILEAKWEKDAVDERPISAFERKIDRRLDNTLGLFISLNGFTDDGLKAVQRSRPNLILMDGRDLTSVIEGCIDLRELIERKLRFATETGDIYLPVHEILNENK